MSRGRPVIGVTGPDEGGAAAWWFSCLAVWRAGGRARRLTPSRGARAERLDGLVIGGGADVDPSLYGVEPPPVTEALSSQRDDDEEERGLGRRLAAAATLILRRLLSRKVRGSSGDPARDALETALLDDALRHGLPILGICRGAQLLNVHLGGSLHRQLEDFYEETPQIRTVRPRKRIEIEPESLLRDVLGTASCRVNALHSQAVDRLAADLRIVARETTGVVQAVEHRSRPYVLGVQWHPEYLPQVPRQQRLFSRLVTASRPPRPAAIS